MSIPLKKTDALIRHEILNAMTTLRFLMEGEKTWTPVVKQEALDTLAWAGFLVGHQEGFYQKPPPVFLEESHLQDLVEIARVLQPKASQKKITFSPSSNVLVWTDRNRSKDILAALLRFTLEHSDRVELRLENHKLLMLHQYPRPLPLPLQSPLECLTQSKLTPFQRLLASL